jgi:plasmid stabilization system protein ParE
VKLSWTSKAVDDLARLHQFLAPASPRTAGRAVQALTTVGERLLAHPRLGERLEAYRPREVRRFLVGSYELRYEVQPGRLVVLRVWHAREDR